MLTSWFHHLLVAWPWACDTTSLGLSFLLCHNDTHLPPMRSGTKTPKTVLISGERSKIMLLLFSDKEIQLFLPWPYQLQNRSLWSGHMWIQSGGGLQGRGHRKEVGRENLGHSGSGGRCQPEWTDHRWGGSTWGGPGLSLGGSPPCPQNLARPDPARDATTVVNEWLRCRVKGKYYGLRVRTLGTPPCSYLS